MEISVRYLPIVVVCLFILTMSIKLHLVLVTSTNGLGTHFFQCNNVMGINLTDTNYNQTTEIRKEMCFLGQAGNVLWVLGSLLIYIKYRQVKDICNRYDMDKIKIINKTALQVGLIASVGVSILVNFQEIDSIYIHWSGVFLFFGFGSFYQSIQTGLYFCICKIIGQRKVVPLRIALSSLSMISFLVFFICAMMKYHVQCFHGWDLHIISLIFEWICAISTIVYLALFYWEFTKITLYEPDLFVIEKFTSSANVQQTNEAFEGD